MYLKCHMNLPKSTYVICLGKCHLPSHGHKTRPQLCSLHSLAVPLLFYLLFPHNNWCYLNYFYQKLCLWHVAYFIIILSGWEHSQCTSQCLSAYSYILLTTKKNPLHAHYTSLSGPQLPICHWESDYPELWDGNVSTVWERWAQIVAIW